MLLLLIEVFITPVKTFYLTGASTHPGGGAFAASGHNTAQIIFKGVKDD